MRTENEMMALIIGFARDHDDVRTVVMTGSRTNPAAVSDAFQDYDISYLVRDVAPFRQNLEIPAYFGEMMILQTPDDMGESPSGHTHYAYLMQFTDGNRIDLTFRDVADLSPIVSDSLSLVLLDKDGPLQLPPPSLSSYLPRKPSPKQFFDCCNEFWWLNPYVAKGLCRGQIAYAKTVLDGLMREQLLLMLTWYIGLSTDFRIPIGMFGKGLQLLLPSYVWKRVELTYSDAQPERIWHALFAMNDLFRTSGREIATHFGFWYLEREDAAVSLFIEQIRARRSD